MEDFSIRGCKVRIYPSAKKNAPIVYLNMYSTLGEGIQEVYEGLRAIEGVHLSLAAIYALNWNTALCPWECPPIFKGGSPYIGGADGYYALLVNDIIGGVKAHLGYEPSYRVLAGYSLGGAICLIRHV